MAAEKTDASRSRRNAVIVAAVVVALFAVVLAKGMAGPKGTPGGSPSGGSAGRSANTSASLTSVDNDALSDYGSALKAGKPIYVLFHSLTCASCVEISGVADKVVPGYAGKVTFVNAITDDPSGGRLASMFSFQYIPTSFFLKPDGTVVDSYTGVLSEAEMKSRLDKLAAK